jgi:SAM-dependent methyltransferase
MIRQLIPWLVLLILVPYVLNQARKPSRWAGRFFLWSMNHSHSALTDWGLGHATIGKGFTILDVGCGGGRTIQKLAAIAAEGTVFGVDISAGSVDASRANNLRLVDAGRVEIRHASVSRLPFPDATFDLVTAVETHYYWPDPPHDLREVLRVVKPGGRVALIAESYRTGTVDFGHRLAMMLLRAPHLSVDEHREWFRSAGFSDVQVFEERGKRWICVTGTRPSSAHGGSEWPSSEPV